MASSFTRSLSHAFRGLRHVWKHERNFRIQLVCAVVACIGSVALGFSALETILILLVILFVLCGEIFNTLLEDVLDIIHPDHHATVRNMKDMMAGVVLLLSCGALLIGALIVIHHFWSQEAF